MTTYKDAGVDAAAGDALVDRIAPLAQATHRPEVISGVGGFASLFALPAGRFREPVLVSGTDGVGTKLKIAFEAGRHRTIGIDLVAMSVNDVLTTGAEPLFFLDYLATSRLDVDQAEAVVRGIADGCKEAGVALVGGETAELPGFYRAGEYDLAGFCVGVVERSEILDGSRVTPGDALVGFGSTGLHSNGYSLARRALFGEGGLALPDRPQGFDRPLGDVLLEPTRIYAADLAALGRGGVRPKALAHITGSGIPGNLPRCLPPGVRASLRQDAWPAPPIFDLISKIGRVSRDEMFATFNMGLGMIAVVSRDQASLATALLARRGTEAWVVGEIVPGEGEPSAEILL